MPKIAKAKAPKAPSPMPTSTPPAATPWLKVGLMEEVEAGITGVFPPGLVVIVVALGPTFVVMKVTDGRTQVQVVDGQTTVWLVRVTV